MITKPGRLVPGAPAASHDGQGTLLRGATIPRLLCGRYQLRGLLGRGGMAEVHDGWDLRLQRPVAVKLLLPSYLGNADDRRRFEFEAHWAAALNHPNIVAVHDIGEDDGLPFIVMERLSGPSLDVRIAQGTLSQTLVRNVLSDVLSGLAAAHAAGILHRDIKPGNVVFAATGDVKITDFGVAKGARGDITAVGHVLGTQAYLSPERVMGKPATPADDLYALGVLGYEALTGRRPFMQDDPVALARAILQDEPPPILALRPDADPALAAVIERAKARNPAERFDNAETMLAALWGRVPPRAPNPTRVMAAPLPPPPVVAQSVTGSWRSGSRGVWLGLAAMVSAFLLAIAMFALASSESSPSRPANILPPSVPSTSAPAPSATQAPPEPPSVQPPPPADKPDKGPGKRKGRGNDE